MERITQEETNDRYSDVKGSPEQARIVFQDELQNSEMQKASNKILQDSHGTTNETSRGVRGWFQDDLSSNLFAEIGKLQYKWINEYLRSQQDR